eukprot:7650975-Pyramimonas_sp.AAC.1
MRRGRPSGVYRLLAHGREGRRERRPGGQLPDAGRQRLQDEAPLLVGGPWQEGDQLHGRDLDELHVASGLPQADLPERWGGVDRG